MARIEATAEFRADVVAQLAYLDKEGLPERVAMTARVIDEAVRLLRTFPELGREIAQQGPVSLRAIRLRRVPFTLTYALRHADEPTVMLLRLFHVRQRRPR